jgi:hypothetical protein
MYLGGRSRSTEAIGELSVDQQQWGAAERGEGEESLTVA